MAPSQKVLEAFNTPIKTQVNRSVFTPGSSDKSQKVLDAFNKAENVQTSAPVENSAVSNNRAANILGAAGQGTASGFVNAAGMMAEGGIKANEAQNAAAIADLETRIADQQRMLDNAKKAGVLSAKDEESYINTITALQTQLDAYKGASGAWEGSAQAAYQYADQLSQESALKQEAAKQGLGTLGQFAVDVGIGAAQLAGDIGAGAITGTGMLPLFVRAAGSAGQEARQSGATYGQQVAYGLGVGAVEAATEKISSIGGLLTKWAGKGVADNLTEQAIKSAVERLAKTDRGKAVLTTIANMGVSGVGEGFEEIIAGAIEPVLQKATYNPDAKWNWEDIIYEGLVALPIGAVAGGVPVNRTQAATPSRTENQTAQQVQNNPVMNVSSAQAKAPTEAENLSLLAQRDAANAILGSSIGREYVKNTYGNETNFRNAVKEANPQLNDVQAYVVMANEVKSNLANNTYTDKNAVKEQARIAKLPQLPSFTQQAEATVQAQAPITPAQYGIDYDDIATRDYAATLDKRTARTLDGISRALGLQVKFADTVEGGIANAAISGNTVTIERFNPNPVRFLFGHEITHRMQDLAPQEYIALRDSVMQTAEFAAIRQEMAQRYANNNLRISDESLTDEAVADYVGKLMEDKGELEAFINRYQDNRTMLEKLRDLFADLAKKLRGTVYAKDAEAVRARLDETLKAAAGRVAENNVAENGDVRYSRKRQLQLPEQEYARLSTAINTWKVGKQLKDGTNYVYLADNLRTGEPAAFYLYYQGEYGAFSVFEKYIIDSSDDDIISFFERVIDNGNIKTARDFDRMVSVYQNGKDGMSAYDKNAGNRRTAAQNDGMDKENASNRSTGSIGTGSNDSRILNEEAGNEPAFSLEEDGVEIVDDSAVKYSLKTWTKAEEERVRKALVKSDYDRADVDKWIDDVNGIASIIAADQDRLDYTAADNQKMLKDNQEYKYTLDASTLCAKRLLYQGTFNAIQHRLPNTVLSSDTLLDISAYMKKKGYETPCGVCYVESRRRHLGNYAQKWLNSYKGEYRPTLAEVTTSDGLEKLRKTHPGTYEDFTKAMKKIGTNNPKVVELRTAYNGDLSKISANTVKKLNDDGGLRIQSFSDFETPHLIDMMQAILDMSAKGLKSQAYTKVPNFAWAFGDTGIKINLSLIAEGDGLDAHGNLIFSSSEGIDFDEAMRLRDAYPETVGTIIVGVNDKHILAAMADDRIDYIIPFHKSGWGQKELAVLGMEGYKDYTMQQKEKAKSTGKNVSKNLMPSDYWDYSKTGKENAQRYLQLCHELNRIPKFSSFLVKNNDGSFSLQPDGSTDGYWKTLIDFKMYDNKGKGVPQQVVKPNFNMDEAKRILEEYEGGADTLPVAQDVVDHFVELLERKNTSPRMSVKETPNVKRDVKQLIDIANEEPPTGELPTFEPKKTKKGDSESKFGESVQATSIYDDKFKDIVKSNDSVTTYDAIADDDVMKAANDILNTDKDAAAKFMALGDKKSKLDKLVYGEQNANIPASAIDVAMGFILMHRYQAVGNYEMMTQVAQVLRKLGTSSGQTVQMFSILGRMTPEGMVFYAQKSLDDAWKAIIERKSKDWIEKHKDEYKLTEAEIDSIIRNVTLAAQMPNGRDRNIILAGISQLIADKVEKTTGQKIQTLAKISMLLNPKTQVRNVLGNVLIMPRHIISDFIGSAIDKSVAKKTNVRTTGAFSARAFAGAKKGWCESFDDFRRHINTQNMDGDRFEVGQGRVFKSNVLNALDRFLSFVINVGDRPFYETWFINSLNNQMRMNNATEPTAHMIEIATQEALQRTWQDENTYTKLVSGARRLFNFGKSDGYRFGNMLLPFVKTPANLTKAIIDFSPVGAIYALTNKLVVMNRAIEKGEFTPAMQREYVKALSQGITGTLLMIIYGIIAAKGFLTGGDDEDKDVANFEKNIMGIAPYSFKIGDRSISYSWMQPAGGTMALIADIRESVTSGKYKGFYKDTASNTLKNAVNIFMSGAKAAGDVIIDQSFLKGIQTLFGFDGPLMGVFDVILAEPAKFVPTLSSQVAGAMDDTARTSYVYGDPVQTAIYKAAVKIPGLRQQLLPPVVDQLGREVENADNLAVRAINSFLNPAIVYNKDSNKAADEMYRLYKETGEASAIPPVAEYKFVVKKEDYYMTPEERTTYQKVMGQEAVGQVNKALDFKPYGKLSDAQKLDVVEDIYSYAKALARAEVSDYELAGNDAKAAEAEAKGIAAATYFIYKATGDLNGNGSINQEEAKKALDKLPLTKAQKATLWQLTNSQWSVKNNPYK